MRPHTCETVRAAALDPVALTHDWMRRPDVADHLQRCPECRDWLAAFAAGDQAWASERADAFVDSVLARTSGVDAVLADLPLLAEMDPGPGFADRVLRATSHRPAPAGWRARWTDGWQALVRRPRFAWEAAYVATVCWVLVFGNPVGAIEWSATSLGAAARAHLGSPASEFRADLESWRARYGPDPAAPSAAPGQAAESTPPVVRAWQAAAGWIQRVTLSVIDVLEHAWAGVTDWFAEPAGQAPPPGEPPPGPARSSQ